MHNSNLHNSTQQITNQMFINVQTLAKIHIHPKHTQMCPVFQMSPKVPDTTTIHIDINIILHFANTLRWPVLMNYVKTTQSKCKLTETNQSGTNTGRIQDEQKNVNNQLKTNELAISVRWRE